uniref:Uncharacterized protein n=1 Tax=Brassica campestris TaxID=3711 RepID=A0A3P6ANE2_BRACM|nr:unnamed protein product [Brassica rapa]
MLDSRRLPLLKFCLNPRRLLEKITSKQSQISLKNLFLF